MKVKVKAPGSCGELVQGTVDGEHFLITCPIDMYSEVKLISGGTQLQQPGNKVVAAVEKTLRYLEIYGVKYQAIVQSGLPTGKGMASSSADISAACQAAALHVGKSLLPDEIASIALSIEPTDGIFFPGIVMFDHVSGHVRRYLGMPPQLSIMVYDVGGQIDTVSFNQRVDLLQLNKEKEPQVRQARDWVIEGIATGDIGLIGRGATLSARANQSILDKPCLETMIEIAQSFGAVGVNVAHSGTVIGMLFAPDKTDCFAACRAAVEKQCSDVSHIANAKLAPGGLFKQVGDEHEWEQCF